MFSDGPRILVLRGIKVPEQDFFLALRLVPIASLRRTVGEVPGEQESERTTASGGYDLAYRDRSYRR